MERGYIHLWRKIRDCEVLHEKGKVYSKYEAWLDICAERAKGVAADDLQRGEFRASYRYLAKAWNWDISKTYRFIQVLIASGMLEKVKHQMKQEVKQEMEHLKVCNYDLYNPGRNGERNTKRNKYKEGFKEGFKEGEINTRPSDGATAQTLLDIYQQHNQKLPEVKALTPDRQAKCRSRINQAVRSGCLEQYLSDFARAVEKAQLTPFLCGNGSRGWRASFDWFIANHTNLYAVLEGKYDGTCQEKQKPEATKPDWLYTYEEHDEQGG